MDLHIHLQRDGDLGRQIYRQIRDAIHDGRLRDGERVPPTRELAARLAVSRNTVMLAYDWLTAEGLLAGRRGGGTIVRSAPPRPQTRRRATPIRVRHVWRTVRAPADRDRVRYDFGAGWPDATLFPFDVWRRLLSRQIRSSNLGSRYGDPAGHPRLREAIAHDISIRRGVAARVDDVIVTNGAQGAFDLIARLLVEPGTKVAVEDPGYPPARLLFDSAGARVVPVAVDASGIDTSSIDDDVRVVYVTPSHQFPLGMPMAYERRIDLVRWAARRNAVVIEDDYDSEFRFGGRPLDTLQALDDGGRVIYVGSFSKSLLPALRLGFLVAPRTLSDAFRGASYVAGGHVQWPAQAALAAFIEDGLFARHVRRMRRVYAARHEQILDALRADFTQWLTPIDSLTGMHLAATLHVAQEREIARGALEQGVAFDRLSTYYASRSAARHGLVLGYGSIPTGDIKEGLRRLRRAFA